MAPNPHRTAWDRNVAQNDCPSRRNPAGDVADYVDEWPQNPFSGGPMVQGDDPGDFVYSLAPSGTGKPYTLSVYVSPWSPPDPTPI
jgi:hypothetical protein